jgi:RNA polymerase sigma factor (sigma-70 family)
MTDDVAELLLSHRTWLSRLARDLVGDDSDDVVQETLRIALQRPPAQSGTLRVWLQRVARNVANRTRRDRQRQRTHEGTLIASKSNAVSTPHEIVARQQLVVAVAEAVRDLDEPYRTVVHLRYHEGLPPREIAARTATNVATVKTRLLRARERLREALERRAPRSDWRAGLLAALTLDDSDPVPGSGGTGVASTPAKVAVVAAIVFAAALPLLWHADDSLPLTANASVHAANPSVGTASVAVANERRAASMQDPPPAPTLPQPAPAGERVRGIVVDASGNGIAGAFVFAGSQVRARGDEPGKPFEIARVRDAVKTDDQGAFELAATTWVTAWHPEHSPRTVAIADTSRIVLARLWELRGRLLDAAAAPRAATELRLDRTTVATTDAAGVFRFERVAAGVRLLHLPGENPTNLTRVAGGPWLVHVSAEPEAGGNVPDVTLAPGLAELRLQITDHGDAKVVALVGLATGTSLAVGQLTNGATTLADVVPGDYQLLTDRGGMCRVTVAGSPLQVELGRDPASGWLVVETTGKSALHAVAKGAEDMVRTLAARIVRLRRDDTGFVRIGPLPPGDYEVCRGDEPCGVPVVVAGKETKMKLD